MNHHHLRIAPNAVASFSGKPSRKTLAVVKKLADMVNAMTPEELSALKNKKSLSPSPLIKYKPAMKIKLSKKQKEVIEIIRSKGVYRVSNSQNKTVLALQQAGVCKYNSNFDGLILADLGKTINTDKKS